MRCMIVEVNGSVGILNVYQGIVGYFYIYEKV